MKSLSAVEEHFLEDGNGDESSSSQNLPGRAELEIDMQWTMLAPNLFISLRLLWSLVQQRTTMMAFGTVKMKCVCKWLNSPGKSLGALPAAIGHSLAKALAGIVVLHMKLWCELCG